MNKKGYRSLETKSSVNRREFLKLSGGVGSLVGVGLVLGTPPVWTQEKKSEQPPQKPETNLNKYLSIPRTKNSLPGLFPGRVVEVFDPKAMADDQPSAEVVTAMFKRGIQKLTGKSASYFG